eukprot:scaffold317237_cov27-Prasinocladus_malaysianus.AAC.1
MCWSCQAQLQLVSSLGISRSFCCCDIKTGLLTELKCSGTDLFSAAVVDVPIGGAGIIIVVALFLGAPHLGVVTAASISTVAAAAV